MASDVLDDRARPAFDPRVKPAVPAAGALPALSLSLSLALALAAPRPAAAQAIADNGYAIDAYRGTVIGSGRAEGLGGAYTALVEGLDGVLWNPAAIANRPYNDASAWRFDNALGLAFTTNDNNGSRLESTQTTGLLGLSLQYSLVGVGDIVEIHGFSIGTDPAHRTSVTLVQNHAEIGMSFFRSQLALGVGYRFTQLTIKPDQGLINNAPNQAAFNGNSLELGAVFRPIALPLRVGLALHSEVSATLTGAAPYADPNRAGNCGGQPGGACLVLPARVVTPWEVDVGVAYQFGPRPWNARWEDPSDDPVEDLVAQQNRARALRRRAHEEYARGLPAAQRAAEQRAFERREEEQHRRDRTYVHELRHQADAERKARYDARPRQFLLVSLDVQVLGPVRDANGNPVGQGMDAFVLQQQHPSGRDLSFSPRLGLESEPWSNRLRVRLGGYVEPSRYYTDPNATARFHVTTGFDVRLFSTNFFGLIPETGLRVSAQADLAPATSYSQRPYYDYGFSIGFW